MSIEGIFSLLTRLLSEDFITHVTHQGFIVEFLSYVNLHFHFTLMQKFKFWYQLEDNSIRNNFGPSVQRAFHMGGQGAPSGA